MIRPVSFAVHGERAGAANPFAAIRVERDWFLAGPQQILVEDVEHLEKRRVRRNVADVVAGEFAGGPRVALSPDSQPEVHS